MITQIVPLQHAPADRIAATLRPFVQGGNLVVQGNLLIVTDTAANIARLLQIVSVLDVEVATDELRLITVRYADAVELARILNEFFSGRRVRTPSVPVARPGARPAAARRAGGARRTLHRAGRRGRPAAPHPRRQAHELADRVRTPGRRRAGLEADRAARRGHPGEQARLRLLRGERQGQGAGDDADGDLRQARRGRDPPGAPRPAAGRPVTAAGRRRPLRAPPRRPRGGRRDRRAISSPAWSRARSRSSPTSPTTP